MLSSEETARARYKSDKKMKMFVKRRSTEIRSGIGGKAQTIYRSPEKTLKLDIFSLSSVVQQILEDKTVKGRLKH